MVEAALVAARLAIAEGGAANSVILSQVSFQSKLLQTNTLESAA